MSRIRDLVKWADFFVDLMETIESIRLSMKNNDKAIAELGQQNMRLLERISFQHQQIETLQQRVQTLEAPAMQLANLPEVEKNLNKN